MMHPRRAAFPIPPTMANGVPAAIPHAPATTSTETAFDTVPGKWRELKGLGHAPKHTQEGSLYTLVSADLPTSGVAKEM
jgi:hypothetical protein